MLVDIFILRGKGLYIFKDENIDVLGSKFVFSEFHGGLAVLQLGKI